MYMHNIQSRVLRRKSYDEGSFVSHPSGDKSLPQLWSPISKDNLNGAATEFFGCHLIQKNKVVKALKKYYERAYGTDHNAEIMAESEVTVAGNAWKYSLVISSMYGHNYKNVSRSTAHNIVLFEVQASRYKIISL